MKNIKEVFFSNTRKTITLLTQSEMLKKIETKWLSKDDMTENKKQNAILKHLKWFQKFKIEDKEFFVEKSGIPLKLKNELMIKKEKSVNSLSEIIFSALFPIFMIPCYLWLNIKNWYNKTKINKGKSIILHNINNISELYVFLFLIINAMAILTIAALDMIWYYLAIVILNLIIIKIPVKTDYINIENFDIEDFTFTQDNVEDTVEDTLNKMPTKEIVHKDKKSYDFLNENYHDGITQHEDKIYLSEKNTKK